MSRWWCQEWYPGKIFCTAEKSYCSLHCITLPYLTLPLGQVTNPRLLIAKAIFCIGSMHECTALNLALFCRCNQIFTAILFFLSLLHAVWFLWAMIILSINVPICSLPDELVLKILDYLTPVDLLSAGRVCRRWLNLTNDKWVICVGYTVKMTVRTLVYSICQW